MRAFIEYPEAGEGRIEVTSEFVVISKNLEELGEEENDVRNR